MKNLTKKSMISLILTLIMIFNIVPFGAFTSVVYAADEFTVNSTYNSSDSTAKVTWSGMSGTDYYLVYLLNDDGTGSFSQVLSYKKIIGTTCTFDSSYFIVYGKGGQNYKFWVAAYDSNKNKIGDGESAVFQTGKGVLDQPTATLAQSGVGSWGYINNATSYRVTFRSGIPDEDWESEGLISISTFKDSTKDFSEHFVPGQKYFFTVYATDVTHNYRDSKPAISNVVTVNGAMGIIKGFSWNNTVLSWDSYPGIDTDSYYYLTLLKEESGSFVQKGQSFKNKENNRNFINQFNQYGEGTYKIRIAAFKSEGNRMSNYTESPTYNYIASTQHTVTYKYNDAITSRPNSEPFVHGHKLYLENYEDMINGSIITAPNGKELDYIAIDGTKWTSSEYTLNSDIEIEYVWKNISSHTHSTTLVPAVAPTCISTGNNAYYSCTCGKVFKAAPGAVETTVADETLPIDSNAHSWNDWMEITPATETTNGLKRRTCKYNAAHKEEQIIPMLSHTHTYTLVPAVAPTCISTGNNEYYSCTCGKYFKDASGSVETTVADETLPIDANAHSWDAGTETTPATCTSEGVRTLTCQHNSGHTKTETIAKKAHTIVKVDAVSADCETDGNKEYYKCTDCDKYFEDISGTVEITDKSSVVIAKTGHNWGAWTQTIAPTQTTDGEEERVCQNNSSHKQTRPIPMLSHTHTLIKTDEVPATCETTGTKAYWTCSGCGRLFSNETGTTEIDEPEVIAKTEHTWDAGTETTPATCTSEGIRTYTCTHNSSHTKTETIAKKAHTLSPVSAVAPTCEVDGIKAHYKCSECNKTFEDALGTVEMTSIVDPATGHDWNEWVETTPATVDAEGEKTRTCKHDSSHKETGIIDKLALEITEGGNKTYTLNSGAEVKIKCNGTFTNFDKLTSNGTEINTSNYDKESGSTVVTLKNSYLDSLSEGTYKLAFVYNDGRSAETNLTIAKASENNSNEDVNKQEDSNTNNNQSSGTTENTSSITPKTGDSITLWIALMVVAVVGTVGTVRYIRKKD